MNDDEIETAKETIANGMAALWVLHGNKVSDQLDQALNEQISYDFEKGTWSDIIGKLDQHPKLAEYVRQRVFSGIPPETYSEEPLSPNANTAEQLRWAWKELKGTTKSVDLICEHGHLKKGLANILRVAKIEEELLHTAVGLMVDYACEPDNIAMLERAFADTYNGLDVSAKWSLMPLFFNEAMTKRESRFLSDQSANDAYYKIFQKRLSTDGISIPDLKEEFLESGVGDVMPCLHYCDPNAWNQGKETKGAHTPTTDKREPFIDDKNLDQILKAKSYSENQSEYSSEAMDRQNNSTDESQVFRYNFWTHDPDEKRIWIRSTDSAGAISLELQYFYLSAEFLFADAVDSKYLQRADPLNVKISIWKNLLEIFTESSSLTFESCDDNEEGKWEYYLAKLTDSWTFDQALKVGDSLIISFDNHDEHQFGLARMDETMSEVTASYKNED